MSVKFCPIASGSDGNSIYIGNEYTHILIDAGISGKRIKEGMEGSVNISPEKLDAIFITHEHTDHIQGAGVISRKYNVPVFATEKTWLAMERHNLIGAVKAENRRVVYAEEKCVINDIAVQPFDIPHDAAQPVGYCVYLEDRKISVATDMGCVTDNIRERLYDSDILLLESNHDLEMLRNGRYPAQLKRRILGDRGHLSNKSAGELLTEIISSRLKHVFLGHLSAENNRPLIAMDTVTSILECNHIKAGREFNLYLAQRGVASDSLIL